LLYKDPGKCDNCSAARTGDSREWAAANTNCGSILIVDDDANYRAFVSTMLGRVGYGTREASSGEEALNSVRSERPSCVLLDVLLPGVTGYAVCRELRDEYGETLPIIFVTGERTEPGDRVAGLLLGADDYVVKPFDPDELLARVRRSIVRSQLNGRRKGDQVRAVFGLTDRERDIVMRLADGMGQQAIAAELVISPKTVATHIQRILAKLGVHSRAEAVAVAHREGLTRPPA
jgi:two-component system, NarL family, nitrate/nitrite response regulator NarL